LKRGVEYQVPADYCNGGAWRQLLEARVGMGLEGGSRLRRGQSMFWQSALAATNQTLRQTPTSSVCEGERARGSNEYAAGCSKTCVLYRGLTGTRMSLSSWSSRGRCGVRLDERDAGETRRMQRGGNKGGEERKHRGQKESTEYGEVGWAQNDDKRHRWSNARPSMSALPSLPWSQSGYLSPAMPAPRRTVFFTLTFNKMACCAIMLSSSL
jgi:hypothetical protein